ncbi:MAG: YigZ family protein, partial [Clostridiales bacterium]|nr:YigZ family protein [Clostridiales bacterium]
MAGYQTVKQQSYEELIEKKSRFIARCYPIESEEEALSILAAIRKEHHDATHNCWAYRLTPNGSIARYSDDGEPGGTAGLPILNAITGRELTDVLVIVTRYFGGILLGAGGLVRTYGKSAGLALDAAGIVKMLPGVHLTLKVSYPMYGKIT